jgi:predicted O-methyltransferase YrrM
VYSPLHITLKYIRYWLIAENGRGHGIHSPFVFDFVKKVLRSGSLNASWNSIETIRKQLLNDDRLLEVEDYGAGSSAGFAKQRRIQQIASRSLKSSKYARLLCRLVQFTEARNVIELGTSLGITTAYLAVAHSQTKVVSFEGAASVSSIARENFRKLELHNIEVVDGPFDKTIPESLNNMKEMPDFIFIDGNHTYEATLRYFEWFLPRVNENTVMVFDDIHWSKGMEQAWQKIAHHEKVTLSIDLFFIGIIFFRKNQWVPQHFTIRY